MSVKERCFYGVAFICSILAGLAATNLAVTLFFAFVGTLNLLGVTGRTLTNVLGIEDES